jgi:ketosteroid isomerase-like protein
MGSILVARSLPKPLNSYDPLSGISLLIIPEAEKGQGEFMNSRFLVAFLLVVWLVVGCQTAPKVDTAVEKNAIALVLDNYVKSLEHQDLELFSGNLAHDSSMINFEISGPPIIGWNDLEESMRNRRASVSDVSIEPRDTEINLAPCGTAAWATSLWNLKATVDGEFEEYSVRCTWVLEKRQDMWLIVHFHKSIVPE